MLNAKKMKLVAFTVLGLGALACSSSSTAENGATGDGGGGGGGGGTMSFNDFCNGLLTAVATIESQCEGGSVADWQAQNTASAVDTCAALASAETAGRVKYDATQATACLAAYNALTCDSLESTLAAQPASCAGALSGAVANGGACFSDSDCAATSTCDIEAASGATQSCSGKCKALLAAGATCTATESSCISGYECTAKTGSTKETCAKIPATKLAAKGATCGFDESTEVYTSCESGLACDGTTSKCVALIAVGGACTPSDTTCEPFTYCDGTTKKCTAGVASGKACGVISGGDVTCAAGLTCKLGNGASTGTCGTLGAAGAACTGAGDCLSSGCGTNKKCTAPCSEL